MSFYIGLSKIKQINAVFNDGVATNVTKENIKTDVRILGVDGEYTASGTQTAGYDIAASGDIVDGKSAWANGIEILGTLVVNKYYTGSGAPSPSLGVNGDIYLQQ